MSNSRLTIAQLAAHVRRDRRCIERDCKLGLLKRSHKIPGIIGRIEVSDANRYIRLKYPTTPQITAQ